MAGYCWAPRTLNILPIPSNASELRQELLAALQPLHGGRLNSTAVFDVATPEWISEFRRRGDKSAIFVDHEQINALEWQVSLNFKDERPVFHYNEFMIRSAELLVSWGDLEASKRVLKKNELSWSSYNGAASTLVNYERPMDLLGLTISNSVLGFFSYGFVVGHEFGHALQNLAETPVVLQIKSAVKKFYREKYLEPSISDGLPKVVAFLRPPIDYKLGSNGEHAGEAIRSSAMMGSIGNLESSQKEDLFCDFVSLFAVTKMARDRGISHAAIIRTGIEILEAITRLTILRQTLGRTPRYRGYGCVRFEEPHTKARIAFLLWCVRNCRLIFGKDHEFSRYWSVGVSENRSYLDHLDSIYGVNSLADAVWHFARGAFYLGTGMKYPEKRWVEQQLEKIDPRIRSMMAVIYLPYQLPEECFDITAHHDWKPGEGQLIPSVIGFNSALRDAVEAVFGHSVPLGGRKMTDEEAGLRIAEIRNPRAKMSESMAQTIRPWLP